MLVLKPWRIQILLAVVVVLFFFSFVVGIGGGDHCDKSSIRVLDNGKHEFSFLMKIVYDGLLENGFRDVKLVDHIDTSLNCLYITADTHDLKFLPSRYIAYNWEQLTVTNPLNGITKGPRSFQKLLEKLNNAVEVWDFSPLNTEYLKNLGIDSHVILPGYPEKFYSQLSVPENVTKIYDALVWMNWETSETRKKWVNKLKALYPYDGKHKILFGNQPVSELVKAKVSLNIHFYTGKTVLEIHRIMQMVSLRILVLSERSNDTYLDELFAPMVTFFDNENDFVLKYQSLIALSQDEYEREATIRLNYLKSLTRFPGNFLNTKSYLWKLM